MWGRNRLHVAKLPTPGIAYWGRVYELHDRWSQLIASTICDRWSQLKGNACWNQDQVHIRWVQSHLGPTNVYLGPTSTLLAFPTASVSDRLSCRSCVLPRSLDLSQINGIVTNGNSKSTAEFGKRVRVLRKLVRVLRKRARVLRKRVLKTHNGGWMICLFSIIQVHFVFC